MGANETTTLVLDREQLREVTFADEDLMRQLVDALIEDTDRQLPLLAVAIRSEDGQQCARLAHYCKGACANIGARAVASVLEKMERSAHRGELDECGRQLATLAAEVNRLRAEEIQSPNCDRQAADPIRA